MNLGEVYRQSKQKKELNGEIKTQLDSVQLRQKSLEDKVADLQLKVSELIQNLDTIKLQFSDAQTVNESKLAETHEVIIDLSKRMTSNGF